MKLPIRVSCKPLGINNWEVTISDRRNEEVFLKEEVVTSDIKNFCDLLLQEVAKMLSASIEIL